MAGQAISIDSGASGLLRHRFVRAMCASTLVLMVAAFIGFMTYQAIVNPPPEYGAIQIPLFIAFVWIAVLFMVVGAVAALAAVVSFIHRRLTAFLLLWVNLVVFVLGLGIGIFGIIDGLGLSPPAAPSQTAEDLPPWQVWSLAIIMLCGAAIAFEGLGWSWWQMRIGRAQYFAARGWRPPPWRLNSMARQTLGLPAFISNFGRGRMLLTGIYFLVAVVNLGLIAMLLVPFGIFSIERGAHILTPVLVTASFAGLAVLNAIGLGTLLQNIAAKQASRLYQKARDWDSRPPVLFLRQFDQDAAKLKARSIDPWVKFPAGCGESRTLDELLLESASVYGPVIAIGDPRDPTPPLGAARVFVEGAGNEWQHVVSSLLRVSNAVVMCPSTSAGVQWELNLIEEAMGRLKIIFIANPLLSSEETRALFAKIAPHGEAPDLKGGQTPIAAYLDDKQNWIVLTTKMQPSVQTYTVALNYALQALLGLKGVPMPKKQRGRAAERVRAAA